MANEITQTLNLSVLNGSLDVKINRSIQVDQTTARGGNPGFLVVGTTHELVDTSDLVSPGIVFIENIDATNFIQFGLEVSAVFRPLGKIKIGEGFAFRLEPTAALYLQADTAAANVTIQVFDD